MAKTSILGSHWRRYFFTTPFSLTTLTHRPTLSRPLSLSSKLSAISTMDDSKARSLKKVPTALDAAVKEEYASQSKLLEEFIRIPNIDKAWVFNSENRGEESKAMFSISQPNLLANKRRKFMISAHISKANDKNINFNWAPFPVEMTGVSVIVPSPSGTKLLTVRNPDNDSPVQIEIWGSSQVEKEFKIPQSIHGSLYVDGWFEGISWNHDETLIAYVAEEPPSSKPVFTAQGFKEDSSAEKDCNSWKGRGDWEEDWGETYAGKRQPALFVINIDSGEVRPVKGIDKYLSVGQVVWAPSKGSHQYLVFVGWPYESRKLGIKYCYNRLCALYAVKAPDYGSDANEHKDGSSEDFSFCNLTESINSAFFPRVSPDGNSLVFLSANSSVDSGAHSATNSLHRINWSTNDKICPSSEIIPIHKRHQIDIDIDISLAVLSESINRIVIPVVMCADDGCFPGLYSSNVLTNPWLSDGSTMILSSVWHSREAILSVNILSGEVLCISPPESNFSWHAAALDGDCVFAVASSPIDLPQIKYGVLVDKSSKNGAWKWFDISSPVSRCSEKVRSLLSSLQFSIIDIPVKDTSSNLTKGACNPFEAIFVSSKSDMNNPLIVILHGGPHSVSLSSFSKSIAFLSSIGFNILIVNYRGSIGFGEEALQSLPGKVGSQDVNDVLTAIDHIVDKGLADPSKISVLGGSHGGFLTTHLIGQAPEKFVAAAARNPVCNLSLMVGTTDIPEWCYVEAYGSDGKNQFTESPSMEHLAHFYSKSPISYISKVKTPTLFLLGAQDLRVPYSNGLQYARALKEKGVEVKIIIFPDDVHSIDRPQSDFESFLNIGVWFKKYCN